MKRTTTLSKNEDGSFNLLIQNEKGRILFWKRGIPFREAAYEIENRMYVEEENDD